MTKELSRAEVLLGNRERGRGSAEGWKGFGGSENGRKGVRPKADGLSGDRMRRRALPVDGGAFGRSGREQGRFCEDGRAAEDREPAEELGYLCPGPAKGGNPELGLRTANALHFNLGREKEVLSKISSGAEAMGTRSLHAGR